MKSGEKEKGGAILFENSSLCIEIDYFKKQIGRLPNSGYYAYRYLIPDRREDRGHVL